MVDHSNEVLRAIGRIEGKMDQLVSNQLRIEDAQADMRADIKEQSRKVEAVRLRQNYHSGGIAAVGSLLILFKDKIAAILFGG